MILIEFVFEFTLVVNMIFQTVTRVNGIGMETDMKQERQAEQ